MYKLSSTLRFHRSRCLLIAVLLGAAAHLSAQAPDAGEDIRPAKEVVFVPKTLAEKIAEEKSTVALWTSITVSIILLIFALVFWRRYMLRRRLNNHAIIALMSLAELEAEQDAIGAEAFAYLASKIVRQYIAEHFGLAAPRRTTEEFLRDLAKEEGSSIIGESDHLRMFLKSCDLAKFAGSNLDANQRGELINAARDFIRSTTHAVTP